jgi:hypothetical protein
MTQSKSIWLAPVGFANALARLYALILSKDFNRSTAKSLNLIPTLPEAVML